VGNGAKNGHSVITLNHHRQPLIQEGFLAVIITDLSDKVTIIIIIIIIIIIMYKVLRQTRDYKRRIYNETQTS